MADPRDEVAYDGIDAHYTTYAHDNTIVFDATQSGGAAQVGRALTLVDDKKVGLADDGDPIVGELILVEVGGKCNVQDEGYVKLPAGDGAAVTPGSKVVGDLGPGGAKGYIRNVAPATLAEVAVARGEIIDATDATKVVVKL
jgi:hypothetical protein